MTEERPDQPTSGGDRPPAEETPSWPRRAAKAAAGAAWQDLSDTGRRWLDDGRGLARSAWVRRPPRGELVARLFLLAIAAAGISALLVQAALPARLPTDLDWRAASALLDRDARPGDAVIVSPAWAERARVELPARVPVFTLARYGGEPLLGVYRAWVLSLADAPRFRTRIAKDVAARASSHEPELRIGALTVTRYDLAEPERSLAFLPDRLAGATATFTGARCERMPAAEPPQGKAAVPHVAREVREVDGAPHTCITAPPGSASDGPVTITFPSVPMGLELQGGAGVVGSLPSPAAPPIRLAAQVDGQEVASLELPAGAPRWLTFKSRTGAMAGEARTVTFVLSTPDPAGRTVCFDAWTVP